MKRLFLILAIGVVVVATAAIAVFLVVSRGTARPDWTTDSPRALEAYESALDAMQKVYMADAIAHLERAVELDPSFVMPRISLSWLGHGGNDDGIAEFLRSVDTDKLTERERMFVHYYGAHIEQRHDEAEAILDDYLADHPDDPYALNASCDEAWVRVAWDRAERCYEHLLERHPNWMEAQRRLGYLVMAQGRFDAAEERFQAYRYIAPDQANPHDSLGELKMLRGRYDAAEEAFRLALTNKADFCPSHAHLVRLAVFEEAYEEAYTALAAMADHPTCAEEAKKLGCYVEILVPFTQGAFETAWTAGEACPEMMAKSILGHRVALLSGHEDEALAMEVALREGYASRTMTAPLEQQRHRSAALHFEGARLMATGKIEAGVARLAEADGLITYWGDGRWSFKLVNRLDWAGGLALLGRDDEAEQLRGEIDRVNPRFAATMGAGSRALASMAQSTTDR